ncbi:MAG: hypothetical protein JKY53_09125 [Flavobacteriales bacterium]|nr:hypothetical protein [Flavobacteriales bacterium]
MKRAKYLDGSAPRIVRFKKFFIVYGQIDISKPYGTSCTNFGKPPPLRDSIEILIEKRDIVSIEFWIRSKEAVKKVYGAEAMLRLSKEGVQLSEFQEKKNKKNW